jgi:hypothetical protein
MAIRIMCPDDPPTILQRTVCLATLSKDLEGRLSRRSSKRQQCRLPQCVTLKVVHRLQLKPTPHPPCDSPLARAFDGPIEVVRLVTVFDQDGMHRGFHAGEFTWTGSGGFKAAGRLSGVTNLGTHRTPAFKDCQRCNELGVLEGRLCGQVVQTRSPALKGCQVIAAYRIRFDPSTQGGSGAVRGTLEGVIVCPCRP